MFSNRNLLQFSIRILLLFSSIAQQQAYRFHLDIGNPLILCPGNGTLCGNGKLHYLCKDNPKPQCSPFKPITMTKMLMNTFVQGHNGIRNKVADDFNIANMNLVHWSRQLALMAKLYLQECQIGKDTCLTIGEKKLKVNQNYIFRTGSFSGSWPPRVVRHWYIEVGYKKTFKHFLRERKNGKMENFTQMTWPLVEFIGCAAAGMNKGHFFVCFYYPPYDEKEFEKGILIGEPCTKCIEDRAVCSKTFGSLCGIDIKMDTASWLLINDCLILCGIFIAYMRVCWLQ